MKNLILAALLIALPGTAFAVESPSKFEAYKERLAARKLAALETRRAYNASRAPHVYWGRPVHLRHLIGIEEGWVRQPAIPVPVRTYVGTPYVETHYRYW